jgi:hypothetical protein
LGSIGWTLSQGAKRVLHVDPGRVSADRRVNCYQSVANTIV